MVDAPELTQAAVERPPIPSPRTGDGMVGASPPAPYRSWLRRRRALIMTTATAGAGVAVLGWATHGGLLDGVPLVDRVAAAAVEAAGAAALVGSWLCHGVRWHRRTLPVLLAGVVVATGTAAAALRLTGTVTDAYPALFAVWVGTAVAALAGLPVTASGGPRRLRRSRRIAAAAAVPLTMTGALMLIDGEYGIWPHLGDLLGHTDVRTSVPGLDPAGPAEAPNGGPDAQTVAIAPAGDVSRGVVADIDPPSTTSHFIHRPGVVYLPPAYFGPDRATLPVVIMMAGAVGSPVHWLTAGGAAVTVEAYAAAHHGVAPVLVVVDQNGSPTTDTECVDGPQGPAETYLTVDVPIYIVRHLRLRHDPARWAVAGFSEGGTCAVDLVLGHPDLYRHVVDLAGDAKPNLGNRDHTLTDLYGGSRTAEQAHDPAHLLATRRYPGVTAWFAAGADDHGPLGVAHRLTTAAGKAGITAHDVTIPGGHNWQFANAAFAQILPRLCTELGKGAA